MKDWIVVQFRWVSGLNLRHVLLSIERTLMFLSCFLPATAFWSVSSIWANDLLITLCPFIHRPRSPNEVCRSDKFHILNRILSVAKFRCSKTASLYVSHVYLNRRGTPLCFRLSVPVGSGFASASPFSHHLPQPGLPAWPHPCLLRAQSSETVPTAEVSHTNVSYPRSSYWYSVATPYSSSRW